MTLTIVTLQFHYRGYFVSDPTLRYANGITSVEKINIDVDELHIMLFHKIALELGVENVETFGCRVNKKGIDVGFEDIDEEKRGRFEGNLGGDDPYFDSSNPDSDISKDEGGLVENDEVKNVGTSNVTAGTSAATVGTNAATSDFTNAEIGNQSSVNAGPSAIMPTNASSSGVRPVTALASVLNKTSSAPGQKRKTITALRGGATLGYKRPRRKKKKQRQLVMVSYLDQLIFLLFSLSGTTDRVLHSAILSSSTPTNIELGYKPNGLRWKERVAVTQRQLREESYRSTQGTTNTHATPSTQGTH
ncbi:hypothetical protein R3W88_016649 [Solanum pinnatisectum]|uniref:Uncharacterized protein n=1 Tax=Solanum pinnatisectum TaxID=50273 RepID=A0AAV9KYC8_9SOLN|nr:hypothetical protein R3W88_016649 [Solanum pinnatisectum]